MRALILVICTIHIAASCNMRALENFWEPEGKIPLALYDRFKGSEGIEFSPDAQRYHFKLYVNIASDLRRWGSKGEPKTPIGPGSFVLDFANRRVIYPEEISYLSEDFKKRYQKDPVTGRVRQVEFRHLTYSPNGQYLAVAGSDGYKRGNESEFLRLFKHGKFLQDMYLAPYVSNREAFPVLEMKWTKDSRSILLILYHGALLYDIEHGVCQYVGGAGELARLGVRSAAPIFGNQLVLSDNGVHIYTLDGRVKRRGLTSQLGNGSIDVHFDNNHVLLSSGGITLGTIEPDHLTEVHPTKNKKMAFDEATFIGKDKAFVYTGRIGLMRGMLGYYDPDTKDNQILFASKEPDIEIMEFSAYVDETLEGKK